MTASITAPALPPAQPSGLALDSDGLQLVERVLRTLLSPLDHPDWLSWRAAAHRELVTLPGVEAVGMHTPLGEGPAAWLVPHVDDASLRSFTELLPHDIAEPRLIESRLDVAHQSQIVDRPTLERNILFAEFVLPNQLVDTTLALQEFGGAGPARLWFTGRSRSPWDPDARRLSLIRTVLPAFRAGLAMWHRIGAHRAELVRVLDGVRDPLLLLDIAGRLHHANPAAARLMKEAVGPQLRAAAQDVAWTAGALLRRRPLGVSPAPAPGGEAGDVARDIRVGASCYRLRGTFAPETMPGREPVVLVTIEVEAAEPLSDDQLRARYRLTPREIAVARLLAEGLTNQEIGGRLGLSFYTARNHVERVLSRLAVGNRARVGAVLRGEQS